VKRYRIPYAKPFIVGHELDHVVRAVREGQLSGNGEFTQLCQRWLEARYATPRALLTQSCTAALEMAAILCALEPGDEVIMPSFTFVSTANAFVLRGARPVFVDIRADTLNIDERLIEQALTPRTRAIAVVHYGGVGCAMGTILRIARARGIRVIEDAAHAFLARSADGTLGAIGDLGCLSFHETKNVISGEGGALLVQAPDLVARAEIIWEKGTNRSAFFRGEVDRYTWVDIGSSFLPSELTAAFLWGQMEHAEQIIARRRALAERYHARLAELEQAGFCQLCDAASGSGHIFHLLTRDARERDALIASLKARRILAVSHYVPLHASPAGRRYGRSAGTMAVTDRVSETLVRLPLYFEMRDAELDEVCEAVRAFYRG
jgi:dTDP-4-amino-4,6-dideoxygalactose transaminase